MAKRISVVISQGQSANPSKRKLEEDLVGALLFERGVEVTVIPHLYDLTPDGTGMLALQGIAGDMVVVSWLFPRAARWILDRNGICGREGQVLLAPEVAEDDEDEQDAPDAESPAAKDRVIDARALSNRAIYCLDFRVRDEVAPLVEEIRRIFREAQVQTVGLVNLSPGNGQSNGTTLGSAHGLGGASGPGTVNGPLGRHAPAALPIIPAPSNGAAANGETPTVVRVDEGAGRRWYPVIDYARCTNCMECIDFCLFGVYGVDKVDTILVEQPDNCRKGCPACSRVCPENAIIFPQHKSPAIAGGAEGLAGGLKIDLSALFGAPDPLELAARERDVELVAVGRDAVGMTVGIPKRQSEKPHGPKDELDSLLDQLDDLAL